MQAARVQKEIDIFSTVLRMRECRINMVQSEVSLVLFLTFETVILILFEKLQEQYEYVYRCMSHFVNTRLFSSGNIEDTPDTGFFFLKLCLEF